MAWSARLWVWTILTSLKLNLIRPRKTFSMNSMRAPTILHKLGAKTSPCSFSTTSPSRTESWKRLSTPQSFAGVESRFDLCRTVKLAAVNLTASLTANRNASRFPGCSWWTAEVAQVARKSRHRTAWTTVLGIRNQRVAESTLRRPPPPQTFRVIFVVAA